MPSKVRYILYGPSRFGANPIRGGNVLKALKRWASYSSRKLPDSIQQAKTTRDKVEILWLHLVTSGVLEEPFPVLEIYRVPTRSRRNKYLESLQAKGEPVRRFPGPELNVRQVPMPVFTFPQAMQPIAFDDFDLRFSR